MVSEVSQPALLIGGQFMAEKTKPRYPVGAPTTLNMFAVTFQP